MEKSEEKPRRLDKPKLPRLSQTIEIDRPAREVWMRIAAFGDMSWHPRVVSTRGGISTRPGTTRVVMISHAGAFAEALSAHSDAGMFYAYRTFGSQPQSPALMAYAARLSVKPLAPGQSRVIWEAQILPDAKTSPASRLDASRILSAIIKDGLAHLKLHMEAGRGWAAIPEREPPPPR